MIPQEIINKVLDIDLVKIFEDEGIELKRSGNGRKVACCPFHQEKTPSLSVDVAKNLWHCFGCGEGGNGVSFIMKIKGFTYPEAIRYLAQHNGIHFEEKEQTPEEREAQHHKDRLYTINREAQAFFTSQLSAPVARDYLKKRSWDLDTDQGREIVGLFGIGFAPRGNALLEHLKKKGWSRDEDIRLMEEAGLISRNEDTREPFDFFRSRITFPIYNTSGLIVGFSGRDVTGEARSKYVNTRETPIYSKSRNLFGWSQALRRIATERKVILVEGNPDAIRLHEIGVDYAVAPLGTALTPEQIEIIGRKAQTVIIIGDRDAVKGGAGKDLPGDKAVITNGEALTRAGIAVQVMELPQEDPTQKVDADSYFQTRKSVAEFNFLLSTATEDYIPWICRQKIEATKSDADRAKAIVDVCQLLSWVKDDNAAEIYVDGFAKRYKNGAIWKREFLKAKGEREREVKIKDGSQDMLSQYGFYIADNCYCSAGQSGSERYWSNFIMRPILHIRDEKNARRIYELQNNKGQVAVVKFNQSELVSFTDFKTRVETAGNFIWEASQGELTTLKKYLYDGTPSADEIRQLGWQKQWEFYAWGNGGFDSEGNFVKADKYGIIEISGRKYYIPGCSLDTMANTQGYQQQRRFVYAETNDISLRAFCTKLIEVFGDNAKVGLCFLVASLFRDVIVKITTGFPILNLFGPKGSGKSELGHALTSFFIPGNKAPNINNATKAALAEAVAEVSNAVVHLDEFRDDIETDKREFLKGLWDSTGRSRLSMENKKDREITAVDCGVIMSGQQQPSADIALLSRVIYLTFDKTEFSDQEKNNFETLQTIEKRGLTHLTRQMLRLRPTFIGRFRQAWDSTLEDFTNKVRMHGVEDRTLRNWVTVLAAFRAIEIELDMPFSYREMLEICAEGCVNQNKATKASNELSGFWDIFDVLVSSGKAWMEVDYKIKRGGKPKRFRGATEIFEFNPGKRYLFLNYNRPMQLYAKELRESSRKGVPVETLRYYLEKSKEYLGTIQAERFRIVDNATGFIRRGEERSKPYQAMVFDYDKIEENYHISLEVSDSIPQEDYIQTADAPDYAPGRLPYDDC